MIPPDYQPEALDALTEQQLRAEGEHSAAWMEQNREMVALVTVEKLKQRELKAAISRREGVGA